MAKGGGFRGGMGGGMSQMSMMKQAQKMQQEMLKMQQELEAKEYTASAGGGAVTAVISGKREVLQVNIDPEAVDPEEVEMLQDMIVAAVNEALRAAEKEASTRFPATKLEQAMRLPSAERSCVASLTRRITLSVPPFALT